MTGRTMATELRGCVLTDAELGQLAKQEIFRISTRRHDCVLYVAGPDLLVVDIRNTERCVTVSLPDLADALMAASLDTAEDAAKKAECEDEADHPGPDLASHPERLERLEAAFDQFVYPLDSFRRLSSVKALPASVIAKHSDTPGSRS